MKKSPRYTDIYPSLGGYFISPQLVAPERRNKSAEVQSRTSTQSYTNSIATTTVHYCTTVCICNSALTDRHNSATPSSHAVAVRNWQNIWEKFFTNFKHERTSRIQLLSLGGKFSSRRLLKTCKAVYKHGNVRNTCKVHSQSFV